MDTSPASISVIGPTVGVVRLPHGEGLPLPAYESAGAAGMDLRAAVPEDRQIILLPGRRVLVPTGFILEIPEGFEGQVRPRSGLALRHGITCLNSPGTIDSDYRGEVQILLVNLGEDDFAVTRGMRIAQLVIAPVLQARIEERDGPGATARGADGFGSTGTA
ncbi:dUTP diphosphatase [Chelativorans sp. SCAU2101]|uniref:Deoxyuridine 5'-triphosphate nucleotidohydrolase n=1 Tax=Chelativorans petroleitrophicus TaxID=2975484 RepID=A0A9X2X8F6_9HYPH|nr:dUTP diphosphatase [Chelativorans petroleitrophicus]MCT8990026.1 dUTP diphosphatase [Chelativorans petroleitrophicus]